MARSVSVQPTEVELQVLNILWRMSGATARQVHNELTESKGTTYSTTVKMLSVMLDKGLVKRDESVSPQIYRAASGQKVTQKRMLTDLVEKVFDGSSLSLVLQALSSGKASAEELAEVRKMVDQLEGKKS